MEKGRRWFTVHGHTNPSIRRSLASRPPYNRKSQAGFECRHCGHSANADLNAARNIRARAAVDPPQNWKAMTRAGTPAS